MTIFWSGSIQLKFLKKLASKSLRHVMLRARWLY